MVSETGFIEFTFCDHDAEEFVRLGRTPRIAPPDSLAMFCGLPAANDPDSPFLADLWSDGECHDDDRTVSAGAIEQILGEPLDRLLARGRAEIAGLKRAMAARPLRSRLEERAHD